MKPVPLCEIAGQPPSSQLRADLAAEGKPVLLAFSRGKDSIAAWLALRDAGVDVIPYHMYLIPHLSFVDESLAYFEEFFGRKIINLPHPSLYRMLNALVFQPPQRCAVIEEAQLADFTYEAVVTSLREQYAPGAWVADGVRAADSPVRRIAMATYGVRKPSTGKVSVVWDWRKAHVMEAIASAGVCLPREYEWFGRSFDGIDYRFLKPLRDHVPADYARVLDWFPLADLEMFRRGESVAA